MIDRARGASQALLRRRPYELAEPFSAVSPGLSSSSDIRKASPQARGLAMLSPIYVDRYRLLEARADDGFRTAVRSTWRGFALMNSTSMLLQDQLGGLD